MSKLKPVQIEFNIGIETIYTDCPTNGNINTVEAAVNNWLSRTDEYTAKSLCRYIESKGVHKAMTEEEYKQSKTK